MMQSTSPLVAIVGVGPGLGAALAARFAKSSCSLALLSGSAGSRAAVLDQLTKGGHAANGYDCDAGDPGSVAATFKKIRDS